MNKEEAIKVSMQIIANSGVAKSNAIQAMKNSIEGNFDNIEELFKEAQEHIVTASKEHMNFLEAEATNNTPEFSVLLIHAEDQMLSTQTTVDISKEFVKLAKEVKKLKEKIK